MNPVLGGGCVHAVVGGGYVHTVVGDGCVHNVVPCGGCVHTFVCGGCVHAVVGYGCVNTLVGGGCVHAVATKPSCALLGIIVSLINFKKFPGKKEQKSPCKSLVYLKTIFKNKCRAHVVPGGYSMGVLG